MRTSKAQRPVPSLGKLANISDDVLTASLASPMILHIVLEKRVMHFIKKMVFVVSGKSDGEEKFMK